MDFLSRGMTLVFVFCPEEAGSDRVTVCLLFDRVSFYTSVGCDVFLFNYRGYGRSGGRSSPAAINRDVKEARDREGMGGDGVCT